MNIYQCSIDSTFHNEDQNSNSDDTDSEEQKMHELEALLYSKVHYAEDLSNIADTFKETDRLQNGCENVDLEHRIVTEPSIEKSDNSNKCSEEESDIATSIYNEILNAKKSNHRAAPDSESDSGMSSGK